MKLPKLILTLTLLSFFTKSEAQHVDEIINNHIKAIGGDVAWKKITSIRFEYVIDNGSSWEMDMIIVQGKGLKRTSYIGGMKGYTIFTPTVGYNFYPWGRQQKPETITPEDLKMNEDNLDIQGPLIDYKAKGHAAEYIGMDEFEGTDCYKIKLTERSGKIITYFIDPSNYFVIHSVTITNSNGRESEDDSDFSNYKKLPEGVWVPMNLGRTVKVKKVEVNIPVDENVFKPSDN